MPRTQVMVRMSDNLRTYIEQLAASRNQTTSELIRLAVVEQTGYQLTPDDEIVITGRPRQYASDDERNAARKERDVYKRRLAKAAEQALMKQQRLDGVEALEDWLRQRGYDVD